jgi:4-hydroxybenzoate polyprenyltransferase
MKDNITAKLYDRLRIYDWFDKLELLVFASTLLMIYSGKIFAKELALMLTFLFCLLSYSFTLNSVTDKKEDVASEKDRYHGASENMMRMMVFIILFSTITSSILIWFLYKNLSIIILTSLCLIIGTFYSLRPIRLKERGVLAPISTGLFMKVLPFLLLVVLIQVYGFIIFYLSLWLFLEGFRRGLSHQVKDYRDDVKQNISTLTTKLGLEQGKQIRAAIRLSLFAFSLSSLLFFDFWLSILMIIGINIFKFRSGPYK